MACFVVKLMPLGKLGSVLVSFFCCDKRLQLKRTSEGNGLPQLTNYNPSLREVKAGRNSGKNVRKQLWRDAASGSTEGSCLASFLIYS